MTCHQERDMQEMLPILIGVAVMIACHRLASRARAYVVPTLLACGSAAATLINGEPHPWPLFAAADLIFVLSGAALVSLCRLAWNRLPQYKRIGDTLV
jgi:hypothetical protein